MAKEIPEVMQKKGMSQKDLGLLFALSAFIIGGGVRLYTAYFAGFPINDGGLFYTMVVAIQKNGYTLPKFIHYNNLDIPFAYPPLGFYISGLANDSMGIPLIEVFRWLPAIVLSISILVFYRIGQLFLKSDVEAGIATVLFALLPRSITWFIMGGGITRSLGQLFFMAAIFNYDKLLSTGKHKYLWLSILFSSLVCLTHPEATIHTIGIAVILWVFKGRTKKGIQSALLIAGGTISFTVFWWAPVLINFGIEPFTSAAQTSLHNYLFILYFLVIPFSDEPHISIIILLAVIGFAVLLAKREYFLPLFYIVPFLIEPRNAANISTVPMPMLASVALYQLVYPGLKRLEGETPGSKGGIKLMSRAGVLLSIYLLFALLIGTLHFTVQLASKRVTDANLEAFRWITYNTSPASQFLVLTGKTDLFGDWTAEWFPTLTKRTSVTTIQGREWIDADEFGARTAEFQRLQQCLYANQALDCIERSAHGTNLEFDYIYIAKKTIVNEQQTQGIKLAQELEADMHYALVYETFDVSIFQLENDPMR